LYDDVHVGYKLEILFFLVAKPQLRSYIHCTSRKHTTGSWFNVYCVLNVQANARPLCITPSVYICQDGNDTGRSCMFKHLL